MGEWPVISGSRGEGFMKCSISRFPALQGRSRGRGGRSVVLGVMGVTYYVVRWEMDDAFECA